jgi:uncharacterized DUF497 family protein
VRLEWDAAKDRANRKKHGLDFATAACVFADPNLALIEDRTDEDGEQRWHALGLAEGVPPLLVVVHVYREAENGEEIIRIISARKASKREGRIYLQQTTN